MLYDLAVFIIKYLTILKFNVDEEWFYFDWCTVNICFIRFISLEINTDITIKFLWELIIVIPSTAQETNYRRSLKPEGIRQALRNGSGNLIQNDSSLLIGLKLKYTSQKQRKKYKRVIYSV